jgi:NADH-dependent peroxiredoxin subunit F
MEKEIYDLIIVGGGPAGMTAGIYASRLNLKTLLITKNFGGQMAKKAVMIENYPGSGAISGTELVSLMEKQMKSRKIDIEMGDVLKIEKKNNVFFISTKDKKIFNSMAVIVATGLAPRLLGVPGEKDFLGRGVSYCSLCDGPIFQGKDVAVIGGGNAGVETAIFLSKVAKKIYILEYGAEPKAFGVNLETAKRVGNIAIITNAEVKEIKGKIFVDSLVYEDRINKEIKNLAIEGVFVEIGYQPETSFLEGLVDLGERGGVKVDFESCQTKTSGLFVAGDLNAGKFKQIVIACGEGAKATLYAFEYLQQ